jgi:hypothetical protein
VPGVGLGGSRSDRCDTETSMDWRDRADQVKPAEDRLIDRYREEFFGGRSPASNRGYETTRTPWGLGRGFHRAMYVTAIDRRSAWPETQMVLDMFWENFPDRHFVVMRAVWPPDRWFDDEPPYNDLYWTNLAEHIHTRAPTWLRVQPGAVVYFNWRNMVDLQQPPADGGPPPALLAARQAMEEIESGWLGRPDFKRANN